MPQAKAAAAQITLIERISSGKAAISERSAKETERISMPHPLEGMSPMLAVDDQARGELSPATVYRVWSPRESPVRIEYAPDLFLEARMQGPHGFLFGSSSPGTIRIVAARKSLDAAGLGAVRHIGTFCVRARGEVFLTENDMERFEQNASRAALVIAGSSAGFFVRGGDESVQSVRSYQEIACPAPVRPRQWMRMPAGAAAIVAMALAGYGMWDGPASALTVREDAGQLRLSWTPTRGTLHIREGWRTITVPVTRAFSSMTYASGIHDVEIRMTAGRRTRTVRFVGSDAASPDLESLRRKIDALEGQSVQLRADAGTEKWRAAALQKRLFTIMKRAD